MSNTVLGVLVACLPALFYLFIVGVQIVVPPDATRTQFWSNMGVVAFIAGALSPLTTLIGCGVAVGGRSHLKPREGLLVSGVLLVAMLTSAYFWLDRSLLTMRP